MLIVSNTSPLSNLIVIGKINGSISLWQMHPVGRGNPPVVAPVFGRQGGSHGGTTPTLGRGFQSEMHPGGLVKPVGCVWPDGMKSDSVTYQSLTLRCVAAVA